MKKQVVIPAVVIAVLVATAFAIHFINFKTEIPNIELVSLQLQLDKKKRRIRFKPIQRMYTRGTCTKMGESRWFAIWFLW